MSDRTTSSASKALAEVPASGNADLISVLQRSLYPGARPESIALVLAWCRETGRDPMKKPIHIVPMYVKDPNTGRGEMRDTLMPGIGTYRTDAANSGQYAGKSEPEFGPDVQGEFVGGIKVTYPKWCKVTVQRIVAGQLRSFTAMEFWTENYASAGRDTDAPNAMWKKRPYGQLAKCAEAQALRMAFPDETGNTNTAEEMEGKNFVGVTIDQTPTTRLAAPTDADAPPVRDPLMVKFVDETCALFEGCKTLPQRVTLLAKIEDNLAVLHDEAPELAARLSTASMLALDRLQRAGPDARQEPKREAPKAAEADPQPPAFEAFATDEFGEPAADGEIFGTEIAFAEWFAAAAAKAGSIENLRENNMDSIVEASANPEAAEIIQGALDAARKRLAPAQEATKQDDAPTGPQPLALTKTPGGKPHWPNYIAAAKAEIAALADVQAVSVWEVLNAPTYAASPAARSGIEPALDARREALAGPVEEEATAPKADPDETWANKSKAWIDHKDTKWDDICDWTDAKVVKDKLAAFKADESKHRLMFMVMDAVNARKPAKEG